MILWQPTPDLKATAQLAKFQRFAETRWKRKFSDYTELHTWSIQFLDEFWETVADFFNLTFTVPYQRVVTPKSPFYKTDWFKGAQLSYTAHILRQAIDQRPALIYGDETETLQEISWKALLKRAQEYKVQLEKVPIRPGDVVAGYLLNHPDSIAAFLAVNVLGGIWTCCSPDFGVDSVVNRFRSLAPKVLIAHKEYTYAGKHYDQSAKIDALEKQLPGIQTTFRLSSTLLGWEFDTQETVHLSPVSVPFDHPIWVLFSSGTTGHPKAITHRTGGMLLEQYKALALHQNVQANERFFWNTTTGWMMWNYALGSLLCGATLCIYNGSANYPDLGVQWRFAQKANLHHFGNGAPLFIESMKQQRPEVNTKNLPTLKTLGSTGSPLSEDAFVWLQKQLPDAQIISLSGGTDVCSAFVGGNPLLPVEAGFLQCKMLGADIDAFSTEGKSVVNTTGELVIKQPMPCMPIYFWDDLDYARYHEAYFSANPKVWTHGDWILIDPKKGIKITGRSDATLNRQGVRMGTAEIYTALDRLDFVQDAMVIETQISEDESQLLLFVVSERWETSFESILKKHLRQACSPRHVPDAIFQVPAIPYTLSGKKMEIPIKKLFDGQATEKVLQAGAMKNPESLAAFIALAKTWNS